MAEEAREEEEEINRGPKGGRKHKPGRGHDRKSRGRKESDLDGACGIGKNKETKTRDGSGKNTTN